MQMESICSDIFICTINVARSLCISIYNTRDTLYLFMFIKKIKQKSKQR